MDICFHILGVELLGHMVKAGSVCLFYLTYQSPRYTLSERRLLPQGVLGQTIELAEGRLGGHLLGIPPMSVFLGLCSWEDSHLQRGPSVSCLEGKGLAVAGSRTGDKGGIPDSEAPDSQLPVFSTMSLSPGQGPLVYRRQRMPLVSCWRGESDYLAVLGGDLGV